MRLFSRVALPRSLFFSRQRRVSYYAARRDLQHSRVSSPRSRVYQYAGLTGFGVLLGTKFPQAYENLVLNQADGMEWIQNKWIEQKQAFSKVEMPSEKDIVLRSIIGVNAVVYSMWKIAENHSEKWVNFMNRHFTASVYGITRHGRLYTVLTSAFSHATFMHLAFNMFMLHEFGSKVIQDTSSKASSPQMTSLLTTLQDYFGTRKLSSAEFVEFYLVSSVLSSIVGLLHLNLISRPTVMCLGASGAVCGVFGLFTMKSPKAELLLLGVIPMTGEDALRTLVALDVVGLLFRPTSSVGYAAHLGGVATAYGYHTHRDK